MNVCLDYSPQVRQIEILGFSYGALQRPCLRFAEEIGKQRVSQVLVRDSECSILSCFLQSTNNLEGKNGHIFMTLGGPPTLTLQGNHSVKAAAEI